MSFNIAIDGPAGAGKKHDCETGGKGAGLYLRGYRAPCTRTIALGLLRKHTDCEDEGQLGQALEEIQVADGL